MNGEFDSPVNVKRLSVTVGCRVLISSDEVFIHLNNLALYRSKMSGDQSVHCRVKASKAYSAILSEHSSINSIFGLLID